LSIVDEQHIIDLLNNFFTFNLTEMTSIARIFKVLLLSVIFDVWAVPLDDDVEINPNAVEDLNYRLNHDVLPSLYKLEITPYFENVSSIVLGV
jgi:hypothetical protein